MGQAMVRQFLQEGANVSYCARTVTNTEYDDAHQCLPADNSARAFGTAFDVSSKEAIMNWVNSSAERVGRIDIVIANG
jgi:NAD(P)-dependent dehydrogenase (short-subunit alcohol dehydrogenase family)